MSVEIIDGTTITSFMEDEEVFSTSVSDLFAELDADKDGLLSYTEMVKELQRLRVMETHFGVDVKHDPEEVARVYESLFVQFDHDMNGRVDEDEFKKETKKMLLAMANGLGSLSVQMALEHDSLLLKAVKREYSCAAASANNNFLANAA
ncbi:hypothetical protein HN51_037490 [Arachis hypogaea]|uniref:EF-hand domain-containing protein n=1 Tax=Arachis hypogaea TaxID=3818 RepID=A0A444ZVL5_ARAHY|nr:uncharacterized protein LOC107631394 [Arachis ipaensis]XP_025640814.1 uncharacterized protein LOC112735494 [Arachis hypogaea]QHO03042.1 uncharacterized protein DS421_13g428960 [Arachis hypogaea]RYR18280.1 hypothetical protein Ahy_B03g062887 [Arachis hypogaea]